MPVSLKSSGGGSVTMDVPSTASTFTLTLPASTGTALTTATAVTVAQGGTGLATLTANNVVLGNGTGTPNFVAPGTNGNVLTSNGTTWTSATPATSVINVQTFTSSGTWTKPSLSASSRVLIQAWGGGGSGGRETGMGGGGGGYNERWLNLSQLGATETITIGAGGAAKTTNGSGNPGGNTTVGSLVSAYGGGAGSGLGASSTTGGGGGGQLSAGANGTSIASLPGRPYFMTSVDTGSGEQIYQGTGRQNSFSANVADALYHGGGGGSQGSGCAAGNSVWGGGGGGASSVNTSGGTSQYAGNGGAGASGGGTAGTQPAGGGGGCVTGNSGAGAAGQVIITVFPA
jgi:hypothetical protein